MGNIVIVIIIGIIILTVIGCAVKASAKYDGKAHTAQVDVVAAAVAVIVLLTS